SERALVDELIRCESLGIGGLVLHPGSHMGAGVDAGIRRIVQRIDAVHAATRGGTTRILLETTAGQGTSIGHTFEQLSRIVEGVCDADRLGVCLDTCHVFAAGYDLSRADGYASMLADVETHLPNMRIECLHVNDSRRECGSHVDRHAHIGKGRIGRMGFVRVMNDPRWAGVPKILETPKGRDGRGADLDAVNLRKLRRMIRTVP
ncbi:MAG: deoxyribonuclease IV, partial [Phycisphaerae bacterium]|nr:deoxyribonuclease IV [Phycisphaerae bacterium]